MGTKSLHLVGIFKFFLQVWGGDIPFRLPLSKELSNKNTTLFRRKRNTKMNRKWARKNNILSKMGIKFLPTLKYTAHFTIFFSFEKALIYSPISTVFKTQQ